MIIVHYKGGITYEDTRNQWKEVPDKQDIIAIEIISELTKEQHTLWAPPNKKAVFFAQRVGISSRGSFIQHLDCKKVMGMDRLFKPRLALIITADKIDPRKKVNTPAEILILRKKCPECGKGLAFNKLRFMGTIKNEPLWAEQVAMVKDSEGNCDVLEVSAAGAKRYSSTLKEMGLNALSLEMLGVNLKQLEK